MDGLVKGVAEQKHTAPPHLNFKADFYLAGGREDFVTAATQSCFSMRQQFTLCAKGYDAIVGHEAGAKGSRQLSCIAALKGGIPPPGERTV